MLAVCWAGQAVARLPQSWKRARVGIASERRGILYQPCSPIWANLSRSTAQWWELLDVCRLRLRTSKLPDSALTPESIVVARTRELILA